MRANIPLVTASGAWTRILPVAIVVFCCASAASGEWVVGGYLGGARVGQSAVELKQPGRGNELILDPVRFDGRSFSNPLYYGYRVGRFFSQVPTFGLEAEIIHAKAFARTDRAVSARGRLDGLAIDRSVPLAQILQRLSVSHGMNFLLANAVFRYPVGAPRAGTPPISLQARMGVGPTFPHPESAVAGVVHEQYQFGSVGVQAAGGAEIRLGAGVHMMAEYKFTRARPNLHLADGMARVSLRFQHGVFGLAYHF